MAPTPQRPASFSRSPVKNASNDANSYAQMAYNNGQNMSFGSQNAQSHSQQQQQHAMLSHSHSHNSQNGMQQSPYRSFTESGQPPVQRFQYDKPQIYTVWSCP